MYDFWYQPRFNVLVSSEWAAPNTFEGGFQLEDVGAGKYGHRLHLWDLEQHRRTHRLAVSPDQAYWADAISKHGED